MISEEFIKLLQNVGSISDKDTLRGMSQEYGTFGSPERYRDLTIARKNEICKRYLSMFRKSVNETNSDLMEELHLLLYFYNDWYNHDGTFHKENDDEIIG